MKNPNPTEKQIREAIKKSNDEQYETFHGHKRPTPPVESWEKELSTLLTKMSEHYLIDDEFEAQLKWFISSQIQQAEERLVERMKVTENTSDGYHTFKELYEFRKLYNAIIFNEWSSQGKYNIHKSKKHFDGEDCFGGGWFIVMATLPAGQISNHYELSDWDLFNCEERERAEKWYGHTAQDVAKRLLASLKEKHDK